MYIANKSGIIYQEYNKMLTPAVLSTVKPWDDILKYNGSETEGELKQAEVLVEGVRLMTHTVTQLRAREMKDIRNALTGKSRNRFGRRTKVSQG